MSMNCELAEIGIGHELDQDEISEVTVKRPDFAQTKEFILGVQGESVWERIINHELSTEKSIWQGQLFTMICSI